MLRRTLFTLHMFLGLAAAIFLSLQGITGAVLVFENEINDRLNAHLTYVEVQPPYASLAQVKAALDGAHSGYRAVAFRMPQEPNRAGIATLENAAGDDIDLAYNPYSGHEIGSLAQASSLTRTIHLIHTRLWGGEIARLVVGWSSVFLLVLSVTGLWLWWPRRIFKVKWSVPLRRTFDLHHAVGFYSAVFLFLFALTGVVIHWEDQSSRFANWITRSDTMPRPAHPQSPPPGQPPLDPDRLVSLACQAAPGAAPTWLQIGDAQHATRVVMKFPEDQTPAGRTIVTLDTYSGQTLGVQNSRTAPLGFKLVRLWTRPLHTGDIFGWPSRIAALVFCLSLALMAVTGPMLWWNRRQRQARSRSTRAGR